MKWWITTFLILPILYGSVAKNDPFLDLETWSQPFVLETKKIEIPGYPNAFNGSITRFNGSYLLSFRDIPNPTFTFNSRLGVVFLDEDFTVISEPQILETYKKNPLVPYRSEDARLITIGDRLFIIYSDNVEPSIVRGYFRVYVAELIWNGGKFEVGHTQPLLEFENQNPDRREKNWVPFDYNNELYLAYSLDPHLIFKPIPETTGCATVAKTSSPIDWPWGDLRGGTQAVLDGDRYISFFHTCLEMASEHSGGKKMLHYFMGAYTFRGTPPFDILEISTMPIVGPNFYKGPTYKPYWKPVRVVFPCGLIVERKYIWVVYGRQDHELWVVKLDRVGLQESLVPVSP